VKPPKAIVAICFALLVSSVMAASLAGAEDPLPESTTPAVPSPESTAPETAPGSEESLFDPCFANVICVMTTNYDSLMVAYNCSDSGAKNLFPAWGNSATNRCGNKTNWLRVNGTAIACMNPGGDRPHPGSYNEVFIAKEYGAFC
jgi:hypothetical protein